jgi:hypothetical protein
MHLSFDDEQDFRTNSSSNQSSVEESDLGDQTTRGESKMSSPNKVIKVFNDLTQFYSENVDLTSKNKSKWLICQNNSMKVVWDLFILLELIFISIVVPYRLAFSNQDSKAWSVVYNVIDVCFGVDIFLTFNTSYSDSENMKEIYDRKKIALNYLKGWFIIDLLSIVPFDKLLNFNNVNAIAKFARIGRLYKIIRMTRLAKLLKLIKSKNTIVTQFSTKLKIDHGMERLVFLAFFLIFFFHMSSCFFVLLALSIEGRTLMDEAFHVTHAKTWLSKLIISTDDESAVLQPRDVYIKSLYFTVTTVATVGYGDISPANNYERIYCVAMMLLGVTIFTFVSGALSSILSNYDNQ